MPVPKLMRMPEVVAATGYTKASIYRLIEEGKFPRPVHLCGGRAAGWVADEVYALIDNAIAERDAGEAA
jgi:prophage regulatory protein